MSGLAPAHYRLPFVERFAPSTRHFGPGKIFIDTLPNRDAAQLVREDKAEWTLDDHLRFGRIPLRVGVSPRDEFSIHGGGETLSASVSVAKFQPLTLPSRGIRIHNGDFVRMADFIERWLRCTQLVILSVVDSPGASPP